LLALHVSHHVWTTWRIQAARGEWILTCRCRTLQHRHRAATRACFRERRGTTMSRVVVTTNLTLDGVMQAPGRPDEDLRGGFPYGGWATPYAAMQGLFSAAQATDGTAATSVLLFGRRTYEDFYSVWPNRGDNPFTAVLNNAQKYVASTTLREPLPWVNSTL